MNVSKGVLGQIYSLIPTQDKLINPLHACAARVTIVVVCVCLSASYLSSRAINRSTNDTTYSSSGIGRHVYVRFSLKLLHSRVTA